MKIMIDRSLTQVIRLTAEMENKAAEGEWHRVQELDAARLAELRKLTTGVENETKDKSEILTCLLQSNQAIAALAREAKSNLQLERQHLLRGRQATGSYQQVQENF